MEDCAIIQLSLLFIVLVEFAFLAFGFVSGTLAIPVGLMGHLADVQVMVCPDFMDQLPCTVLVNCQWSREVRSKRFRTRQTAVTSAVPVCPGAAGRRISLARGADDPGSPAEPALAQVVESKVVGMAGRVDVGAIRQGNALRAGSSDRSAGRDRLRSNLPCAEKEGVPTSTLMLAVMSVMARTLEPKLSIS